MTLNLRLFLIASLTALGACTGTAKLYLYEPVKAPLNGGAVTAHLYAGSLTDGQGTSWTMGGPYILYLKVILDQDDLPPPSCKVTYRSVILTESGGKVVEVDRGREAAFKLEPVPGTKRKGSQMPRVMPVAMLPFKSKLDLAYVNQTITADFALSGCGVVDGEHRLQKTMRTDYRKRPVNELTNRITFF